MTEISKRFEKLLMSYFYSQNKTFVIPTKVENGIALGDVVIVSKGTLKDLVYKNNLIYSDISLNEVAIKLAKAVLYKENFTKMNRLYQNDQRYGKWLNDWILLKDQYQKAKYKRDYTKMDIIRSRLLECRLKVEYYKQTSLSLVIE